MVKFVFQNSTDESLTVSCKRTAEWAAQETGQPSFGRVDIKPRSCQTVEDVKLAELGSLAGELYWTLFICLAPSAAEQTASDDGYSNSLLLRFRARKELTGTSKSYTIMAVPELSLLPRPKWDTSKKVRTTVFTQPLPTRPCV